MRLQILPLRYRIQLPAIARQKEERAQSVMMEQRVPQQGAGLVRIMEGLRVGSVSNAARRYPKEQNMRDKNVVLERNRFLEQQICEAIKKRVRIRFRYDEELNYRTYEPYIIYQSTRQNYLVFGVQTYDTERPFQRKVPRNFEVYYIKGLTFLDESFEPDPKFRSFAFENNLSVVCAVDRV